MRRLAVLVIVAVLLAAVFPASVSASIVDTRYQHLDTASGYVQSYGRMTWVSSPAQAGAGALKMEKDVDGPQVYFKDLAAGLVAGDKPFVGFWVRIPSGSPATDWMVEWRSAGEYGAGGVVPGSVLVNGATGFETSGQMVNVGLLAKDEWAHVTLQTNVTGSAYYLQMWVGGLVGGQPVYVDEVTVGPSRDSLTPLPVGPVSPPEMVDGPAAGSVIPDGQLFNFRSPANSDAIHVQMDRVSPVDGSTVLGTWAGMEPMEPETVGTPWLFTYDQFDTGPAQSGDVIKVYAWGTLGFTEGPVQMWQYSYDTEVYREDKIRLSVQWKKRVGYESWWSSLWGKQEWDLMGSVYWHPADGEPEPVPYAEVELAVFGDPDGTGPAAGGQLLAEGKQGMSDGLENAIALSDGTFRRLFSFSESAVPEYIIATVDTRDPLTGTRGVLKDGTNLEEIWRAKILWDMAATGTQGTQVWLYRSTSDDPTDGRDPGQAQQAEPVAPDESVLENPGYGWYGESVVAGAMRFFGAILDYMRRALAWVGSWKDIPENPALLPVNPGFINGWEHAMAWHVLPNYTLGEIRSWLAMLFISLWLWKVLKAWTGKTGGG